MRGNEGMRPDMIVSGPLGTFAVEFKSYGGVIGEVRELSKVDLAAPPKLIRDYSDFDAELVIPIIDPSKIDAALDTPLPPANAERLLSLIVSPDRLEETLGDFEEHFKFLMARDCAGWARCWYWWQVIALAVRGGLKAVMKFWGGFGSA